MRCCCTLATSKRHAKRTARIIPTRDSFVRAHYPAGTAFQTSCIFKTELISLQPIQHCGAYHKARFGTTLFTDCLVHDDVWMSLVDLELIQRKQFFWSLFSYSHRERYAFHPSAANCPSDRFRLKTFNMVLVIFSGVLPLTANTDFMTSLARLGYCSKRRGMPIT